VEAWGSPYLCAHAAYLRHLGTSAGAETRVGEGVYAVRTRVRSNGENAVLSAAGARVTHSVAEALAGWFTEWDVPASWLCAEGDDRDALVATLEEAGYESERSGWEMRARIEALNLGRAAADAEVRVERVSSAPGLEAWLDVAGACDWFETPAGRRTLRDHYLGLGLGASAPLRHYLARHEGGVVGMASAFFTAETVMLASVAVLPAARRQGIGRELAHARLRDARDRGCQVAVLAPTSDGDALYEALAFESHPQPPGRWLYAPLRRPVS
jgi:GNAT superfamily N-acetyltransferase